MNFFQLKNARYIRRISRGWILILKKMIKERCKLHATGDILNANKMRNRVLSALRASRKWHVREKIALHLKSDSHKWHAAVKRLSGKKKGNEVRINNPDGSLIKASEANEFFTQICTTHPTVSDKQMCDIINNCSSDEIVEVSEMAVHCTTERLHNNCASYPGEPPVKLMTFLTFLRQAYRISDRPMFLKTIISEDVESCSVLIIPKVKTPQSCDQLRPISITPNSAKVAESYIYRSLLQQIAPAIDPYQYGCIRGSRTAIYLVRMYHLIVKWLDIVLSTYF